MCFHSKFFGFKPGNLLKRRKQNPFATTFYDSSSCCNIIDSVGLKAKRSQERR